MTPLTSQTIAVRNETNGQSSSIGTSALHLHRDIFPEGSKQPVRMIAVFAMTYWSYLHANSKRLFAAKIIASTVRLIAQIETVFEPITFYWFYNNTLIILLYLPTFYNIA